MLIALLLALTPQSFDFEVPSETMPAETIPVLGLDAEAPVPPPPANAPWVDPDDVGSSAPMATVLVNQWGWNIPNELPRVLSDHMLGAHNNAIINTSYGGAQGPVLWTNTRIHGFWEDQNKWGIRGFDAWDWVFDRCTFDTIKVEHGCYVDAIGALTFTSCHFDHINGQALQVVYAYPTSKREHETGLVDPRYWQRLVMSTTRNEWHQVLGCAITDVGKPAKSERASFMLSFFAPNGRNGIPGHPVRVSRNFLETSDPWIDVNGIPRDCGGGVMSHKRRKFQMVGNYVGLVLNDRDCVQVWANGDGKPGTQDVLIQNNYFLSKQAIDIRLDTLDDTVVIQRNLGNTEVVISTNPWYVWESNGWDESLVIYRGPVSQNYRLN